jgi:hypothetical protein
MVLIPMELLNEYCVTIRELVPAFYVKLQAAVANAPVAVIPLDNARKCSACIAGISICGHNRMCTATKDFFDVERYSKSDTCHEQCPQISKE